MLKAGRLDDVLADLRRRGGDAEECRRAVGYLAERRDRMRYDKHLAAGLPIGSGIVEAGCKNIVGRRMKCAGASTAPIPCSGCDAPGSTTTGTAASPNSPHKAPGAITDLRFVAHPLVEMSLTFDIE